MPCHDVTVGHYYSQLMTTAHTSCCWPAAARFTEHGQHAGHHSMLGNHGHCSANYTVKVGLKVSSGNSRKIFLHITEPTSCLHHLLPEPREPSVISRLRTYQKYPRVYTRTKHYCSFIHYVLNYYHDSISNH